MFGKYLNNWDFEVVPKGFDCPTCAWMANGGGNKRVFCDAILVLNDQSSAEV